MRRRRLSFAIAALAVAAPVIGAAAVHGCSSDEPFESVCLWVADPENCYREFRIESTAAGNTCKPFGDPTPAIKGGANGTANGSFLARDKIDICFINGGGQVVFDPPIDLANYPPPLLSDPIKYKMTIKNADGTDCGLASFSSEHGFSFTINPPPNATDAGSSGLLIDAGPSDAGPGFPYGSYTQVIQPGRDAFDVTCPSGETHHFNLFETEGSSTTDDGGSRAICPRVQELVPRAELVINPGGINVPGAVSFTIYWPPIGPGVMYPDNADATLASGAMPIQPEAVTYFNCSIGAAPPVCANGVKDGAETDQDCGGKESAPNCPARCGDGQQCVSDCDCDPSLLCTVKAGVKVCGAPAGPDGGPTTAPTRDCSTFVICADGQRDGEETDVDCGGTQCAARCGVGQGCTANTDCVTNYCLNKICSVPNCKNSAQDPGEIGVDCGGPCPACPNGTPCTQNSDCATGNCVNMVCSNANCMDGVKNGSETDIDCGGAGCDKCPNLKTCLSNTDCASKACVSGQCLFPSCSDGVQDGDETDKDCGGLPASGCPTCPDGAGCSTDADCANSICGNVSPTAKKCFPTSCLTDGGILCGGGACPLCDDGAPCTKNSDCLHNGCVNKICVMPNCSDSTQDGTETDVDCGGPDCGGCGPGKKCITDSDCATQLPDGGIDAGLVHVCTNKVCQL